MGTSNVDERGSLRLAKNVRAKCEACVAGTEAAAQYITLETPISCIALAAQSRMLTCRSELNRLEMLGTSDSSTSAL